MNKKIEPKKATNCGIIDLIRHKVFYGHIIQQLLKVYITGEKPMIDTAAVGRQPGEMLIKLYMNLDFVNKMQEEADSEEQFWNWIGGVLEHETLHLVFDHLSQSFADRQRANVAMDCVVNSLIDKNKLPKNCIYPDLFGFQPNKSSNWYYEHLDKNDAYKQMCAKGAFGIKGIYKHAMGSHKMWGQGKDGDDAKNDPLLKEFVKDLVRKAKELCNKDYGNIPSQVIEQIEDMLKSTKPMIPWNKILRQFVASAMESNLDYTMKRTSKRFGTRPGIKKEDVLNLAVAIDTSGSISDTQLAIFMNEIKWIWRNGAEVYIYEADCAIAHEYKFKGKYGGQAHGRGGTDLEPVLKEVEKKGFDALIYFTDFYAPVIEKKYRIPTLWVLTTDLDPANYPVKWGKHVKIDVPMDY